MASGAMREHSWGRNEKKREREFQSQAPARASLRSPTRSGPSAPRTHSFTARICCQKYQLELLAEEARPYN